MKVIVMVAFIVVVIFIKAFFHSQRKQERQDRINAAVEKVKTGW